jgi:hypothetical protein
MVLLSNTGKVAFERYANQIDNDINDQQFEVLKNLQLKWGGQI